MNDAAIIKCNFVVSLKITGGRVGRVVMIRKAKCWCDVCNRKKQKHNIAAVFLLAANIWRACTRRSEWDTTLPLGFSMAHSRHNGNGSLFFVEQRLKRLVDASQPGYTADDLKLDDSREFPPMTHSPD